MQIFGRKRSRLLEYASSRAEPLEEIEVVADADTLRRLASLLVDVASEMDKRGERFEHVHLLDAWEAHDSGVPDIVLSRE